MSQLSEIPSTAYTPEMNTLGAVPDIPTFEGEPVPVSRNPLTSGMRPLQLLPLPGTEFPVRYETSLMRSFQTEVNLGKARAGGSSTDASAFWDLLDPPIRARVVAAGFGDYAAGLCRTQPRFPPAMRYALMERARFAGPVAPLDARYQTATLGAQLVRSLLDVTTQTSLDVWTRGSGDSNWQFIRPLEVWAYEYRIYPGGPSGDTPADSRQIPRYLAHCHHTFASTEDPHYWRCFLNDRALSDERKKHRMAAHYRAEAEAEAEAAAAPAGPARAVLGDVPFPPGMEVVLDSGLGLGSGIIIPADFRQAPPPPQLDPEHATHVPAQRYRELCQQFEFARSFIGRLYSDRHERDLEIGRLRRHQSRQSGAMARLQMEVDQLRTRLEAEGIPLDFSEEDDDGSSSDDAPPSPPLRQLLFRAGGVDSPASVFQPLF
ncbi:hypothetical protein JCGZ_21020 [Jatropha curcas]|uniref:Aminotransferase-like plant mobile domain-containing protein n=1 Tax=Jatropha curcas TaxID=180498 RepID=A0A067JSR4_JATCU|nr:hypothetical protein JCGZ_21020 [Jatropha curcas]